MTIQSIPFSNVFRIFSPRPEAKGKFKETKKVVDGSQEGKLGPVDQAAMRVFLGKLQEQAPQGISFNEHRTVTYLRGGTCSSMAFNLIKDYFSQRAIKEDTQLLHKLTDKYSKSGEFFRIEQVAMNAIEANYLQIRPNMDFKKAKVQAIANPYELEITNSSSVMDIYSLTERKLQNEVDRLSNGVYVLRDLYVNDYNHKGEYWGHTMVFFKFEEGYLLYDPNQGLIQIAPEDVTKELFKLFENYLDDWSLHEPRFYKVSPRS